MLQGEPAAALVQRAEPALAAHQARGGEPVRLPVHAAAEAGSAQTHGPDGQILPVQQAGLELVRNQDDFRVKRGGEGGMGVGPADVGGQR